MLPPSPLNSCSPGGRRTTLVIFTTADTKTWIVVANLVAVKKKAAFSNGRDQEGCKHFWCRKKNQHSKTRVCGLPVAPGRETGVDIRRVPPQNSVVELSVQVSKVRSFVQTGERLSFSDDACTIARKHEIMDSDLGQLASTWNMGPV